MKISIVTINYNNALGLEKTIQSVIKQTYTNYEYIVIDGASTDGSIDIIEKHSDEITYWVSEPDKGVYNAMNKGIAKATGEYYLFLNSGDVFVSSQVLQSVFGNTKYDAPLIRGNQITNFGTYTETWHNFGNRELTLYDLYTSSLHHQATFFRATLFDKYGLYNEKYKIVSDWEFSLKLLLGGESSVYVNIDIVIYEHGGISSNPQGLKDRVIERKLVIAELLPKYMIADYARLYELSNIPQRVNTFEDNIANFITQNKMPRFLFRVISKIYRVCKLDNR